MKICLLSLTCASDKEAEKIAGTLLEKKLVVCTKRFPVSSLYRWKGKIDSSQEVLLIMDSIEENFEKVRKVIARINSYKTFVLLSTPVTHAPKNVINWMERELG